MIEAHAAAAISILDVSKAYGTTNAVCGASLEVRPGEVVALVGPNGAGKTTLIELAEGLIRPDSGSVRVLGCDPAADQKSIRSRIGVVLQSHGVDARVKVREVAYQFASYYHQSRTLADSLLVQFGIEHRRDHRVGTLSGGERRRLDFALAAIGEPEVLFLDEPTAGLDIVGRRDVWQAVSSLATAGRAVLMTTHHFDEAERFADRVALLIGGRIVLEGPPETLQAGRRKNLRASFGTDGLPPLPRDWRIADGVAVCDCEDLVAALNNLTAWVSEHDLDLQALSANASPLADVCMELFEESVR